MYSSRASQARGIIITWSSLSRYRKKQNGRSSIGAPPRATLNLPLPGMARASKSKIYPLTLSAALPVTRSHWDLIKHASKKRTLKNPFTWFVDEILISDSMALNLRENQGRKIVNLSSFFFLAPDTYSVLTVLYGATRKAHDLFLVWQHTISDTTLLPSQPLRWWMQICRSNVSCFR